MLEFEDLGSLVGGGKAAPVAEQILLPETALHTERLRQTNAEVDYSARSIIVARLPAHAAWIRISACRTGC